MALTDTQITALKLLNPEIEFIEISNGWVINYKNWCFLYRWNHQQKWGSPILRDNSFPFQLYESVLEIIGKKNVSIR